MGGRITDKIKELESVIKLPIDHIQAIQEAKLKKLVDFAVANSPYYRSLFHPSVLEGASLGLHDFPILTKSVLREKINHICTAKDLDSLNQIFSSGSTGPPSKIYFNEEELAIPRAVQLIWWSWAGYKFGNGILQTGVNLNRSIEKRIKDFFFKTRYIEALKHDEADILRELNHLAANPKDHFVAYASSLYLFSKVALDHGIKNVQFKSVISLGEKLLPNFRASIEKAFQCKVFDTYGSSEGLMVAAQCDHGTYHLMSPHVIVEIVDDQGQEVAPGQIGTVLLTGLDNFTTPLIRYEIGDLAVKGTPSLCPCGLNLPSLGEVLGRTTEFIVTPGKKYITVQTVVRILKFFPEIERFTLIKKKDGLLELQYIAADALSKEQESKIQASFEDLYSESIPLEFQRVTDLPKTKSGKFQLIVNLEYTSS